MEQDLKSLGRKLVAAANSFMAVAAAAYFVLDAVLPDRDPGDTGPLLRDQFPSQTLLALIGGTLLAVSRELFRKIPSLTDGLRARPAPA